MLTGDRKTKAGFVATSTSNGEVAGSIGARTRSVARAAASPRTSAARSARGHAVLPRRADAGRGRGTARGLPADGGTADRPGQGAGAGPHRGGRAAGHARRPARRGGARAGTPLRPHRSGRRRPRHRRRGAVGRPAAFAERRPRGCGAAGAAAFADRHPGLHLGPGTGRGGDGTVARGGELPRRWSSSTAPCRRSPTRPARSTSSAAVRSAAGHTVRLPAPLYADPSTVVSMRSDSLISRTLRSRPACRCDGVRRRRRVDFDDVVRGQLPGHPDARRTGHRWARSVKSGAGSSMPRACRWTPNCRSGRSRSRSKTSGPVRRPFWSPVAPQSTTRPSARCAASWPGYWYVTSIVRVG